KPSLFGEASCLLCQIQNVFFVSVFDHKDNKTVSRVDSNSDVEIFLENDGFRGLVQTGIEIGMGVQGRNDCLNQKGKISKFHSLFLCYLSLARTCSRSVMSASSQMVTSATRLEASAIRLATVRRMPLSGIFSTKPYASASALVCCPAFVAAVSTFSFVTRPPGPVPFTLARSIPICLAKARTAGVACTGRMTSTTSLSLSVPTTVPESPFS